MNSSISMLGERPEHELLLACARTSASPAIIERIRSLGEENIDWEYLFLIARRHSVVPLLYRQLQDHAADLVPLESLRRLKQHYQENSARNAVLTAELCRLVKSLGEAGIEAIPYKGPVLGLVAYGDLSLRRFVDLDIMVRKDDVLMARDLLVREGYEPTKSLTLDQQEVLLRTQHNMQFVRDNRRMIVELHWEVASHLFASSVKAEDLWRDLSSLEVYGVVLKTLSPDDLIFSLCVHGSRHLWERLAWICDVAELISRQALNWSMLLERAARTDGERMFLLGLALAEKLLGATLPADVKRRCDTDNRLQQLARNVKQSLFNGTEHVPASSREIFRYNIEVRRSWTARARYFVYMMRPTDSDLEARYVPSGLNFMYYLMRPFRLLFKD